MAQIEGDGSASPPIREVYKQECSRGVNLFQESLIAYQQSQIPQQRAQYKEVMNKALQVVHETATQCLSAELQKMELTLEQDYQNYLSNQTPANFAKVNDDVIALKKGM